MEAVSMGQLGDAVLETMNKELSAKFEAEVIFMRAPIRSPLDDQVRVAIESLQSQKVPQKRLCVFLETSGGYIETVQRLVDVMRRHYDEVYFVVPGYAYSAGTVLALSGDRIFMDYYSILGPIDPQVADENNETLLPGAGYLAKFEELVDRINNSNEKGPNANKAELAYLIKRFEPAKLFHIEQAIEHGQALIEEWLPKYKFKNWRKTATTKKTVTAAMRRRRAKEIAKR